jgi:hypothetical protein
MRKNLLAGVAMLGATMAVQGLAFAQTAPAPVTLAPPPMGTLIQPNGGKSANDNNNYQPAPLPGAVATPTPGSMVIRLNGKIWTEYGWGGGSGGGVLPGPTPTSAPYKNTANSGLGTYFRLYPGFDAQATNGLRYGGQVEIRENFSGATYNIAGASAAAATNGTGNTGLSGLTCAQTLYVRRDFVWVSMPQFGLVRLGQGDGVSGIFDNGIISQQGYGQGGWNGDASAFASNTNNGPAYPWYSQQGAEYGGNKIVYLSPQFFGIDGGLEYEPNNGNIESGGGVGNVPSSGAVGLVSSSTLTDGARFINQYQVGLRYQGVVGPVSIYGFGDYIGSGHVDYTGAAPAAAAPGATYNGKFKNLSAGFAGVELTIGGLAIGGGWQGGAYNSPSTSMGLEPENGVSSELYGFGALYTIGALSFGASWYGYDSQGAVALTGVSQRHENGFGLGINYTIAPGLNPYLEALYGTRHQGDYNFETAAVGKGGNTVFDEAIIIGLQVGW